MGKTDVLAMGPVQGGVLERWSATENVTGALERSEKKGWSARVLELRKTSWSAGKLRKIGWSAGALILNCLECWSARQKIVGAWSRGMYWSAGALKEKEVELWSATKKGWSTGALLPLGGPWYWYWHIRRHQNPIW